MSNEPLLTAKAVAGLLGLSASKVYELARSGALVSYRFDGAVRFEPADVEAYKQSCRVVVRPVRCRELVATVRLACADPRGDDASLAEYFRRAGLKPRAAPASVRQSPTPRKAKPYTRRSP